MFFVVVGRRPAKDVLNLGVPQRAWEFVGLANERDLPSLGKRSAQPFMFVLTNFGWRDYRAIKLFPELDLWQRAREAGLRFTFVPRLTGIKLSAAARRGVYRERPSHEQAAWLARIRSEPDLEMTELVSMAMRELRPTIPERLLRLMVQPWRLPGVVWRRIRPGKGALVRQVQRYKGVRG